MNKYKILSILRKIVEGKISAETGLDNFDILMDNIEKTNIQNQRNAFRQLCQLLRLHVKDSDLKKIMDDLFKGG